MAIVPSVVVDKRRPVAHASDLVTIVPPRHHTCFVVGVLLQPVVSLAEVVQNIARSAHDTNDKFGFICQSINQSGLGWSVGHSVIQTYNQSINQSGLGLKVRG